VISLGLVWKEVRETRWKHVVGFLVLAALGVLLAGMYRYLRDLVGDLPLTGELARMLEAQLANYFLYLWANWYGKNLYQLTSILAIVVGMGLVAAEAGNGTLGFLLTRPVSRAAVFTTKYLTGAAGLALTVAGASVVTWLASGAFGHPIPAGRFLVGIIPAIAGTLVIYGVAVLCSTLSGDQVRAGAAAAVLAALLSVPSWFGRTRAFSVYRQMQALYYLSTGTLRLDAVAGLALAAAALALVAGFIFVRKEA